MRVRKIYKFSLMVELVTVLWMKCIAKLNLLCYTSCQVDLKHCTEKVSSVDLRPHTN